MYEFFIIIVGGLVWFFIFRAIYKFAVRDRDEIRKLREDVNRANPSERDTR